MNTKDFFSALVWNSEDIVAIVDLQAGRVVAQSILFGERYGTPAEWDFSPENYAEFCSLLRLNPSVDCVLIFDSPQLCGSFCCSFTKLPYPKDRYAVGFFSDETERHRRLPYIFFLSRELQLMYGSLNFVESFGGESGYGIFNEKYAPAYIAEDLQLVENAECAIGKYHFVNGSVKGAAIASKIPLFDANGETAGLMYMLKHAGDGFYKRAERMVAERTPSTETEIAAHTAHLQAAAASAADSERLCKVFDHSTVLVFVVDPATYKILYSNELFDSVFGGGTIGGRCHEIIHGNADICRQCVLSEGGDIINAQRDCAVVDKWCDVFCRKIIWKDGKPVYLIQMVDISHTRSYLTKAEQFDSFDPLTSLPNRKRADSDVSRLLSMARTNILKGYLLTIDLDNFRNINEAYGHDTGDKLIKVIGTAIKSYCASNQVLYKLGGDKYLVVCQNDTEESIKRLADSLLAKGSSKWFADGKEIYCTFSIGVVRYPDGSNTFNELMKKTDIAVYNAKQSGKACVSYYDNPLVSSEDYEKKMDLEVTIRKSMERKFEGFTLHYQPIVHMESGRLLGAEALIRYRGKDGKTISPADFIPLCEDTGLIRPLGIWIIRKGVDVCKTINDEFDKDFTMNINLSIKQIEQLDLVPVMKEILSASGVNPQNIILELTETAALKDYDRLRESLQNMKKLGVQIALDDFGTGYSSLYLLRAAPFDHIKIDMSYTADIFNKDGSSAAFISLVTEYAHAGGRTICAEGIETEEQRCYLASENVDKGQGYYFSKPLGGSALFELLKRKVKVLPESAEQKKDCPELPAHGQP